MSTDQRINGRIEGFKINESTVEGSDSGLLAFGTSKSAIKVSNDRTEIATTYDHVKYIGNIWLARC